MKTGWQKKRLKHACHINREVLGENTSPNLEIAYLDIGSVDSEGNVAELEAHTFKNAPSRARRVVKPGDTVISTVRTYLKAIAHFESPPENLIASTGFAVLSPRKDLDSRFLWRAVQEHDFVSDVVANSEGVGYPAIAPSCLANLLIDLPESVEQHRISNYLDEQTAKIDRLIALRRRQMELLKEQRAALIQQAVTRGLDPAAPMKDSGIPWLGEIPAHWDITKIKLESSIISKGTTPSTIGLDLVETGIRFLKAENLSGGFVVDSPSFFIDEETHFALLRSQLKSYDLLVVIAGATTGKSGVLSEDLIPANLNQAVSFVRFKRKKMSIFCNEWLSLPPMQEYLRQLAVQSAQPNLSMQDLGNIPIVSIPDLELEQILARICKVNDTFKALSIAYARQLTLLAEYRAALIHECVTGQREVPESLT